MGIKFQKKNLRLPSLDQVVTRFREKNAFTSGIQSCVQIGGSTFIAYPVIDKALVQNNIGYPVLVYPGFDKALDLEQSSLS